MYMGILRSGDTQSEILPELQIITPEQFSRVQKGREQRAADYEEKRAAAWEAAVTLADQSETNVVRPPPPRLPQKECRQNTSVWEYIPRPLRWPHFCVYGQEVTPSHLSGKNRAHRNLQML